MAKVGFRRASAVAVLILALLFLGPEGWAQVAGIDVTTTDDEINADGDCSLREAITAANTGAAVDGCAAGATGADTINVPAGTYTLTIPGTGEDLSATGDLDILGDLTINGAGVDSTVVQAGTVGTEGTPNGIDRVFDVERPTAGATFSGVTVRNGNVSGDGGGGLRAYGSSLRIEIRDSLITGNTASRVDNFGGGGGAHIRAKDVVITNTTFSDNSGFVAGGLDAGGLPSESTLTITDSKSTGNRASSNGGMSVSGFGAVTIEGTEVSGNRAYASVGGARLNSFGKTTVRNSVLSNNESEISFGGGAYIAQGTVSIENSTISDNRADSTGGGLDTGARGLTLNIRGTTISGNTSGGNAGGLSGTAENLGIENSTISGNRAEDDGGGLYNPFGAATLSNATLTNNTSDSDGDNQGSGGGIFRSGDGSLSVENTIIAGNFDTPNNAGPGDVHPDCSGPINSQGHNLIGDTTGCTFTGDTTGNITGVDPLLGPLADNGGPTKTHAPREGSPAVDGGDNEGAPSADQRGVARPQPVGGRADIGAFELEQAGQPPPPPDGECTITGTEGQDRLIGTSGDDVICALDGGDTIDGRGGNDEIKAGPGNDRVQGGRGDDTIEGDRGRDVLSGGPGKDRLDGKDGVRRNDVLDGGRDRDTCRADRRDKVKSCP